jgi:hypothetical protein
MDILRLLPDDAWDAAVDANAPSAANVFATMADLIPDTDTNIYNIDGAIPAATTRTITVPGDSTVQFAGGRTQRTYTAGGVTVTEGAGFYATGLFDTGQAAYTTVADRWMYDGSYEYLGETYIDKSVNDTTKGDNTRFFLGTNWGTAGASTYGQLVWSKGVGPAYEQTGFIANEFGERLASQASGLNYIGAMDVSAGMAFLSGSGGTGYFGATNQAGFASWIGTTLDPSWATTLGVGNASTGNDVIMTAGDMIESSLVGPQIDMGQGVNEWIMTNDDGGWAKEGLYFADEYLSLFAGGWSAALQAGDNWTQQYVQDATFNMRGDINTSFVSDRGINIISHKLNSYQTPNFVGDTGPSVNIILNANNTTLQANAGVGIDSKYNVIVGGGNHTLATGTDNTVILGGSGTVATRSGTAYVDSITHYHQTTFETHLTFAGATIANKTQTFQDATGTIALLSDIPASDGNGIYDGSGALTANTTVSGAFDIIWANTGDFKRTGDITFTQGADRTISVEQEVGIGVGTGLTIEAGSAFGGLDTGGALILKPGAGGAAPGGSAGDLTLQGVAGNGIGTGSDINILSGDSNGNQSAGDVNITTGSSGGVGPFTGGDFIVTTGTGPGARGAIIFANGSEGTVGDVWTEDAVTGKGVWTTPARVATGQTYTITNEVATRTLDADSTTLNELADVVGTLIEDLKTTAILN